ncbi:hypothetical protein E2562_026875 [Oryza meyeriana var. granulata]|uniref:Uncharacterized protein n=1 Tax=Oryza meyeriana var. granulata TaxID=110450 RepID=A0A6G1EPL0_9ORYZ|nr:hypothetical protein E2562_026875 [Oryza meyeriana var. granulata]
MATVPTSTWPATRVAIPPAAPVSLLATTLGVAPAEIAQVIPIYLFLPRYAAVPSRFATVLAMHGMTPLYALSSSPIALPLPSVHVHTALLGTKTVPCLAPDKTAPGFGSGSTSAAAPTHALARDPHSSFLPGTLAASVLRIGVSINSKGDLLDPSRHYTTYYLYHGSRDYSRVRIFTDIDCL